LRKMDCSIPPPAFSITSHLLDSSPDAYEAATQAPFLLAAAEGRLPKDIVGQWLANDRLYIHAYIRAAGQLLATLDIPPGVPQSDAVAPPETELLDWLIEALVGVRREERLFMDVAERYGLDIDLVPRGIGPVPADQKLPGLVLIEDVFSTIRATPTTSTHMVAQSGLSAQANTITANPLLPAWLDGAIMFWGTERCYLDAWSWAKSRQPMSLGNSSTSAQKDADGGALRKEFIPNWSSAEFAMFVSRLAAIIDRATAEALDKIREQTVKDELLNTLETRWKSLLVAEAAFWPLIE
jgi:hypothetical protein